MSRATFFVQDCPVCGRYLQVRLELLGKTVACRHCHGSFIARDPSLGSRSPNAAGADLLGRANELLSSIDDFRPRPR
jgi:hypothetical protein